ncbi:hypothetical protein [Nocardia alba]|uniref:Uncharacterized protein n=1 Tax=Nocardia alba TaxID=225051 RepID=A0A4R1FAY2_9NOCA|nr:hypothetical protein [Nocardia alba]TCJ89954.1 hypothetical protein DFR71_6244 [Nocardia alba]
MTQISGFECRIVTSDVDGAGTNGRVYLGLAGREFGVNSRLDDFERGSDLSYVFGLAPVKQLDQGIQWENRIRAWDKYVFGSIAEHGNDPRVGFTLDTTNLSQSPVYIRFETAGSNPSWNLADVWVLVYTGTDRDYTLQGDHFTVAALFRKPEGLKNLWLGDNYGKMLFLR